MNFELLEGKPIQIVRSERDPLLRKVQRPNVFVKNLDNSVTDRELFLAFSQFGNVLSSTVAKDSDGTSKCYGFVEFDDDGSVTRSIFMLNGLMVKNKILCVQRFVERKTNGPQAVHGSKRKFTNVYVKNFAKDLNDQGLREMFDKFGKVISSKIMTDSDGKSRCFGFVSFERPDAAFTATSNMNGRILPNGKSLYVSRAQKKKERAIAATDGLRSSFGEKRLLDARARRPNWLEIVDSSLQADVSVNDNATNTASQATEKRKPDMATIYRMLSPSDVTDMRTLFVKGV